MLMLVQCLPMPKATSSLLKQGATFAARPTAACNDDHLAESRQATYRLQPPCLNLHLLSVLAPLRPAPENAFSIAGGARTTTVPSRTAAAAISGDSRHRACMTVV